MSMRKVRRVLTQSLLLTLVFVLASQPALVAAQTLRETEIDPISALTASGDAYLTSVSQAALLGAELLAAIEGINAAPAEDLSEEALIQAQAKALAMAEQAAVALGSVDDLADSIEAVSPTLPAPIDVGSTAADGLPDETASDLGDVAGLSPEQVEALGAELESLAEARLAIGASGLPSELEDQLRLAGFSDGEIAEIANALGTRGLADGSLASSMAQFRATQDELAGVRTRALMMYVQLLGKHIAVRQLHGIASRPVTEDELKALAQDELRLLIHIAHLDELWGGDPSLDVGEGDWWFVERYAAQAAERLEAVTLDSQNRGLVVELLLIHQMRTLAISARSGDADYVKAELDRLSELLALQLGDESFVARERQRTGGLVKLAARIVALPFFRDKVSWPVGTKASDLAVDTSKQRLDDLGVVDLTPLLGLIPELDETNNQMALLFAAGLPFFPQLGADFFLAALDILSVLNNENMLKWIEAILTGNTDDPALMVASVLFSLLPVIGVIPDIYTLAVDPSFFVKALSLFGIIGSIGDLIGLIPGLQGIGGVSFMGDAASAVIKALFKNADTAFRLVLDALRLEEAFNVVLDLVKEVVRFVGGTLGSSRDEVAALLREIFEGAGKLWDNFVAFVTRARAALLLKLGISEGTMLVGRMFRLSPELVGISDETIEVLARLGRELVEAGVDLSDEAAQGLGVVARNVAGPGTEIFVRGIRSELLDGTLKAIAKAGSNVRWTDDALEGVSRVVRVSDDLGPAKIENLLRVIGDPQIANETFRALRFITSSWSDQALEGISIAIRHSGGTAERALRILASTDPVLDPIRGAVGDRLFRLVAQGEASMLGQSGRWRGFISTMLGVGEEGPFANLFGGSHVLFFIEESGGFGRFSDVERTITRSGITRRYDLVGVADELFELKNVGRLDTEAVDQLINDLRILSDAELSDLRWVFRGSPADLGFDSERVVERVVGRLQTRTDLPPQVIEDILARLDPDSGVFGPSNIIFTGGTRPFPTQ